MSQETQEMQKFGRRFSASMIILASSVSALPVLAQQTTKPAANAERGLEDIVVTAQRRSESVQDVPIAISAFSPAELERRNITEALDLVQYVPNLIGHNNTGLGTANTYYLRGLGNTETIATFDPPVGSYIDDIYISRQNANNFSFFDVERIEVLRGPQGTLFGRNTTGGAINVILKKPGEVLGGYAEIGYGRFDKVSARASVDLPISANFLTKLSGYFTDDQGYVQNTTTGERLNDIRAYGARIGIQARASETITWDTSFTYSRDKGSNVVNFECDPLNRSVCNGRYASTGLRKNFAPGQSQFTNVTGAKANFPLGNDAESLLLISNVTAELSDTTTLNFITGYVYLKQKFALDFFDGRGGPSVGFVTDTATGRPTTVGMAETRAFPARLGGFSIVNDGKHSQFTQEIKLNGKLFDGFIDYVTGVYFINENNTTEFADVFFGNTIADRTLRNQTKALAGYVQADLNLTDQIKATAGVRYTDEEKNVTFLDNRAACAVAAPTVTCINSSAFGSVDVDFNPATPGVAIPTKSSEKIWTPRFALNFKASDDMLLFASATRGFKSGGWNARGTTLQTLLPFGPEKVWTYEGGAKTEWLDNRLRFNVTGFYSQVKDFQVPSAFLNPTSGALTFITRNFADLDNKGVEIEAQAMPIEGLTLFASAGIQDAEYKVNRSAPTVDAFNVLSVNAQQAECVAALAGSASPRGDTRSALLRAGGNCGVGIVDPQGRISKPVRSPDLTISGGMNYELQLGGGKLIPAVNLIYTSSQEVGTSNATIYRSSAGVYNAIGDGEVIVGSFSKAKVLVNASMAFETSDALWKATVECDNCFGKNYIQSALNYSYINPPTTWQIKLRRKF
jgi:iron complex outermembrane recepter protein